MPNGADVPGGFGIIPVVTGFIKSFFGFGGGDAPDPAFQAALLENNLQIIQGIVEGVPPTAAQSAQLGLTFTEAQVTDIIAQLTPEFANVLPAPAPSPITGRPPIPVPEEGGPPLVTERFEELPPLPVSLMFPDVPPTGMEEVFIPFIPFVPVPFVPVPPVEPFVPRQRREFPIEPDVIFEEERQMATDAPLLQSSLLPALRGITQPTIQGIVGGFTGGLLGEFLRSPQEMGLGQVPRVQVGQQVARCPTEKPHTRILRFIKQNTGVSVKLSRAKSLIRELGLENAARCLGIGAMEACALLIVASPRRRRGISASDVRIVKRTARRFESLKHDLSHIGGRAHPHRRRAHHHRHAHK